MTHEGNNAIKVSKLQILTFRFKTVRMDDYETYRDFHTKLMDSMNSSFNHGEPISNFKVIKKIKYIRSLSERFRANVTAIEESKDVESLNMNLESLRKGKGVALNAIKE